MVKAVVKAGVKVGVKAGVSCRPSLGKCAVWEDPR